MLKVGVLVSGNGTNLQAVLDACASGALDARVVVVVADRRSAFALERARQAGVPTAVVRPRDFPDRDAFDGALGLACVRAGAELVVHAGFMRIVGPRYLDLWEGRCINVHPALLPAFPGLDAPGQAIAYGARITGCTVHFVDRGVDTGPIILQEAVRIAPDDTAESLHRRIQDVEWRLLPQAIALFGAGRLQVRGRVVRILEEVEGACPAR